MVFQIVNFSVPQIDGINGTMVANRYERVNATSSLIRTVVTLDNGGEWRYISPPETDLTGAPILCEPPSCSLHFHMGSSAYARLGIYSQVNFTHGSMWSNCHFESYLLQR